MDTLVGLVRAFVVFGSLVGAVIALNSWRRRRFEVPTWVHGLAIVGLALGSFLAWVAWTSNEPLKVRHLWLIVVMPAFVYLTCGILLRGSKRDDR